MRTKLMVPVLIMFIAVPLFSIDYTDFKEDFQIFADEFAGCLPYNSTVGLGWSDAYIGQFGHFGIGLTLGATTLPYSVVSSVTDGLGINLKDKFLPIFQRIGIPIPAYTFDFRLGGFGKLPFDIGFKFGFIPQKMSEKVSFLVADFMKLDYMLIGGDIRFALLKESKEKKAMPDLSLGIGVNFLKGGVTIEGIGSSQIIQTPVQNIKVSNPDLYFNWKALVLDGNLQLSKDLAVFTLMAGAGISYAVFAEAGGGLKSQLLDELGNPLSPAQIQALQQFLGSDFDLDSTSIVVTSRVKGGWAFRVFGGISINLWAFRIDMNAMYSFISRSLGASVSVRLQF